MAFRFYELGTLLATLLAPSLQGSKPPDGRRSSNE